MTVFFCCDRVFNRGIKMMKKIKNIAISFIFLIGIVVAYFQTDFENFSMKIESAQGEEAYTVDTIPPYSGKSYVTLNDNLPQFSEDEISAASYEKYSDLDSLKRCGVALANIGKDLMPTEERGSIGMVKPSGWHTIKYDIVEGKYLYNRCHLIGYQLTGENANVKNLITCTRYMNTEGMLPFENQVASYVKETGNHVLYRVTPIFSSDNLVAEGTQIEAMSTEDKGEGLSFNVFVYNIQPGVVIDYRTGNSWLEE